MHDTSPVADRPESISKILTSPHVPRLLSSALIGRLPTGMAALAILLTVRTHGGSYSLAGSVTAVYAVAAAIGGPAQGRLIDRTRQPPMLLGAASCSAAGFIGLACLDPTALPVACALLAAVAGAATPQLEPCLRVLWTYVLNSDRGVQKAYALDAATQELIFVAGPLVVLGSTAVLGAPSGLVTAGALGILGSALFAGARPSRRWMGAPASAHWAGPLRSRPLVRLLVTLLFVGATIGAFTVAITAYAEGVAAPSAASWLIAANGGGALIGGLAYAAARTPHDQNRRLRLLLGTLFLGYLPLLAVPGFVAMVPLAVLSGISLPSVLACSFALVSELAPLGTIIEAHAWMITAFGLGNASGAALAGLVADLGTSRWALACGIGAAALAVVVAVSAPARRGIQALRSDT